VSIERVDEPALRRPWFGIEPYFRRMPKNMRSFEESSGFFSVAGCVSFGDASDVDEGAVEAGECSKEPDDADAIML
jgi:hypothetical protein